MRIKIWAFLLDKTIMIDGMRRDVYGLSDFHCRPSRRGLGTRCLRAFEEIAKRDGKYCIVGFCDTQEILQFYLKADWYYWNKFEGKYVFTSIPVKDIIPTERW